MRKYLLLFLFSFALCGIATAQTISNAAEQNCTGAIPVCHGDYQQNQAYAGSGSINELSMTNCPSGNNGALSSGEKNGVWYVINVICNGYLSFTIMPNVSTEDYDWAMWDITGGGCSLIYNYTTNTPNAYPPYMGTCVPTVNNGTSNYSGNAGILGWTGLSQNAAQLSNAQFNPSVPVVAGQTFALLISNFTSSNNGYHLTFDSSTACLNDTIKPKFVSAAAKCGYTSDVINVGVSVPVLCSSIAPNGSDFYITDAATGLPVPGGTVTGASSTNCSGTISNTTSFQVQFASVLPAGSYWLHANVGTDTNTLVDFCTNQQSISDSIMFTLTPPTPPVIVQMDTPICNKARIIFDRGVKCSTVDPDGSDFHIVNTNGDVVQVARALAVSCNDLGLVDTIDIFFTASIVNPGLYTLNIVKGNDGDAITDTCGEIVPSAPKFYVSDGGVLATAYPNLLCEPGYFELGAGTVMLPPPARVTNCGANGTVCNGGTGYLIGDSTRSMSVAHSAFGGTYAQRRTRMLYTKNELIALGLTSGTFSQVAFDIVTKNSTQPFQNFTIKMGCTTDSLIDTSANHPAAFSPALEIVYGPKTYTTNVGWNYFTLDNTYDWNKGMNLLVEICYSDTSSIGDDIVQGTPIPNYTYTSYSASPVVQGCALSSLTGFPDTTRPNMQFIHCPEDTTPFFSWVWTPSDFLVNGRVDTTRAYAHNTTTYTATIIDKDNCYRRDTATVIVSKRAPTLAPADTAVCIGNVVIPVAGGGASYLWYPAQGLSCNTCPNPTVTVDTTTVFYVGIYDQYNCGDTLQARVVINYKPVITVTPKDTLVQYQVPVQIQAYTPAGHFYLWSPGTGLDNPDIPNPIAMPDTNTLYIVTVIDTNKCTSTDSVTIRLYERGVEIPSAFTPNGDGKNDVFRIANLTSQKVAEFRVFNRWGQEVYNGHNNNAGWDGTFNGVEQGIGSYNYIIRVAFHDGSLKTFSGSVTLIR